MKLRIVHEIFHITCIDRDSWADNNRKERDSTVISDVLVVSTERWEELHDKVQRGLYIDRPRGCSRGLADSYQRHETSSVQWGRGPSEGHETGGRGDKCTKPPDSSTDLMGSYMKEMLQYKKCDLPVTVMYISHFSHSMIWHTICKYCMVTSILKFIFIGVYYMYNQIICS